MQSLRAAAESFTAMRPSIQAQSLTVLEKPDPSIFIKSLKTASQANSPAISKQANSYKAYVKHHQNSMPISRPSEPIVVKSGQRPNVEASKLRLKASQILEQAKQDVYFGGGRRMDDDQAQAKRGANSLAILSNYLQPSQSQKIFDPLDQETIKKQIKDRFTYKQASRFKHPSLADSADQPDSKQSKSKQFLDKIIDLQSPKLGKAPTEIDGNFHLLNFQSINTEQMQQNNKLFAKYQKRFQSPSPNSAANFQHQHNSNITSALPPRTYQEANASAMSKGGKSNQSIFNQHSSIMSSNSQASSMKQHHKPLRIQTLSKVSEAPSTYIPHLKATRASTLLNSKNENLARQLNINSSHNILTSQEIIQNDESFGPNGGQSHGERSNSDSAQGRDQNKAEKDISKLLNQPYHVHLLTVSQSQKQFSSNFDSQNVPNQSKLKQERIIQHMQNVKNKDQVIATPTNMPNLVKKSRNQKEQQQTEILGQHRSSTFLGGKNALRRTGSAGSNSKERNQRSSLYPSIPSDQKKSHDRKDSPKHTYGQQEPPVLEQVKLLPLKVRKIFKKAMRELDQVDLVNSDQLPLSRPRIRSILKRMKDNLENGGFTEKKIPKGEKDPFLKNKLKLAGIGRQAERDLFGMLIKEKQLRKAQQEKNKEMQKLYQERMLRKRTQYEHMKHKQELRNAILENNGYLSEESSDTVVNSIDLQNENDVPTERMSNYGGNLVSSERPSSAESFLNPVSVTSRKDEYSYNKMRNASEKRKKKQERIIFEELMNLIDKPCLDGRPPATGNFYNKFQNIDKIIEKENNDKAVTTLQEQAELKELEQEIRQEKLMETFLANDEKLSVPAHSVMKEAIQQSRTASQVSSYRNSPAKQRPKVEEIGKSPIVEYLKQVNKDKLLPHFMPFKKLQEATAPGANSGLKYCLDQFCINTRVAPSLASAVQNLQYLQSMSLVDTMLTEEPFMTIFKKTPMTLSSLSLSQNEHLTPKCFALLHQFENLIHLSLEKCNIGDEIIAVLLDLDPLKFNKVSNNGNVIETEEQAGIRKSLTRKNNSIQKRPLAAQIDFEEEEEVQPFLLSGLAKNLKLFNVSKNRVSDNGAKIISTFIEKSDRLEILQLHWNKIRSKGAILLARSIKKNTTIKVLDISFNSFGSGGVRHCFITDDLKKEEEVHFDKRHYLDKFQCAESAWKWRKTFMKNRTLLHLDISFNGFSAEDMMALSDGLRENHTLLGIHVEGNNAKIDTLGFIQPIHSDRTTKQAKDSRGKEVYDVHTYNRIPVTMEGVHLEQSTASRSTGPTPQSFVTNSTDVVTELSEQAGGTLLFKQEPRNCWLCEGWSQRHFEVRLPDRFLGVEVSSVYIHLSFEDFKPMVMKQCLTKDASQDKVSANIKDFKIQKGKSEFPNLKSQASLRTTKNRNGNSLSIVPEADALPKHQSFELYRMVPPSPEGIQYYFSLQNPKNFRKETFIDPCRNKIFIDDEKRMKLQGKPKDDETSSDDDAEPVLPFPKFVNLSRPVKQKIFSFAPKDRIKIKANPRTAFNSQEMSRPKSPWSLPKSFFAKYKFDNDLIIGKCFDFDWRCSTLDKMIKDPHEKELIIRYLRPKYGLIRETYKHLACMAPAGNMPSLGMNILTELMLKCNGFIDYKLTKLSDVDLAFIATNAVGARNFRFEAETVINPERQIIRYQFFEILIRLAQERFNQKLKMSPSEGIKIFYEQFIQDTFQKYQSHPWRLDKYWNQECDYVINENMETLKEIYNKFASCQAPGLPKAIRLNKFIELVTMSGVCSEDFGAREIGPLYNLSMQTIIDEIQSTRHMDMRFIEFVECLSRIADKAIHHNTVEFPVQRGDAQNQKNGAGPKVEAADLDTTQDGKPQPTPAKETTMSNSKTQNVEPQRKIHQAKSPSSRSQATVSEKQQKQTSQTDENISTYQVNQQSFQQLRDIPNESLEISLQNKTITEYGEDERHSISLNNDIKSDLKAHENLQLPQREDDSYGLKEVLGKTPQKQIKTTLKRQKNINQTGRSSIVSTPNRSASREKSSDAYDQNSDNSAILGELHLSEKLQKYINRIAATCMGMQYSVKYQRNWALKQGRNAQNRLDADAELAAQSDLLGQSGFKATLTKERYSDQRPKTPLDEKNKKKRKA